jgi:hypothetical protein
MLRPYFFSAPKTKPGAIGALRVGEVGTSGRRHLNRDLLLALQNVGEFIPSLCQRTVQSSCGTVAVGVQKGIFNP